MSRNLALDRTHYQGDDCPGGHLAPPVTRCACGHSRSYHRQVDNQMRGCFASPLKAPPCRCAQYRPIEETR